MEITHEYSPVWGCFFLSKCACLCHFQGSALLETDGGILSQDSGALQQGSGIPERDQASFLKVQQSRNRAATARNRAAESCSGALKTGTMMKYFTQN